MAPGRKKGVGRAKARNQLSLGDLVLAKVKGFPPWPAKISRPEDWDRLPDPKKYFVQFFGTDEIAFVTPPDIQAFTDESRSKLSARCQGKPVKYFARAVKEICEAFEELQEKSTGYSRNGDIDGSALCNADFAGDNYESELKDQTNTLGHLEVANTEFPENRVHGLERCSRSRSERVHMDTDHGIACDMGAESSPVLSVSKGITALNKTTHLPKKDAVSSLSPVKEEISPSNGPGHDLGIEVGDANSGEMCPSLDITETHSKGLAGSDRDGLGDVKQNSPIDLVEENRGSPPLPGSLHSKHSGGRDKVSMNGHGCYILPPKSSKLGHSEVCVRLSESGEGSKDETIQKIARGKNVLCDSLRELSPYASKSDIHSGQKPKILLKSSKRASRKHLEKDENSLGARYCSKARSDKNSEERGIDKPFSSIDHKNKITQPRSRKPKVISDDHSVPAKKRTREEICCDMSEKSTLIIESKDSLHSVVIRKAGEKVIVSKRTASHVESGDEDLLPLTKRRRLAVETMPDVPEKSPNFPKKDFPSGSDCGKSLKVEVDEECTTPIHRLSATITRHPAPTVSDCDQIAHIHEESPSHSRLDKKDVKVEILNPSCSQAPGPKIADEKNVVELHVSSPGKVEMQKISNKEKTTILSPGSSLGLDKAAAKHSEHRNVKPHSKPSGPAAVRKAPGGISKGSGLVSESLNHAKAQVTPQRNKPKFSSEKLMVTPKTNSKMNMPVESRLEAVKEDKASCSSMEPKVADSSLSMKHLIAAAQAKRRQAHCQSLAREDTEAYIPAFISTPPLLQGKSPSPVPGVPAFSSGNPMLHQDVREFLAPKPSASPCANSHLLGLQNQTDPEEYEEGRFSLRGSLSGGTEAAVARDAFEGMVETLSRTKESIGRATRLAIDCAKYGIAGEVVELLIRKLENEASFHRRVDLFFLVDSITQCSHSQKGIAGASYIPTVQAALPRLLGAAAPHGAGARENRRQCLKVLRLWHERKILPEVLLRRYMDEIGVPNDDASTGFFLRRPSRAERAVDDPIREMEGMLVDEYGSNATFQLPGFLSSHVFEDEEDLPTSLCMETGDGSSIETANALEEPQRRTDTPSDRRGRILEDVDGELEMEDVSASSKDEPTIPKNDSLRLGSQKRAPCGILASPTSDENELPPLPMGSPPLPAESPPPPPPLPPSPPPPPPPFSPSPPPPPPPPLPPPSLPSSFSSSFTNQPPIPQDYCRTSTKNQLFQMKGNASLQSHANAVPLGAEMILEKPSCFAAPGICNTQDVSGLSSSRPFEFGQNGMFLHPQPSHLNLQFQTCSASFSQRSIQPLPPPQAPSSHFSYVSSTVQQPVHHPYHNYQFPSLPNGRRQYVNDERWRSHSSDPALDNQQGVLLAGGRSTLCSHPPFVQEGFFQSLAERPCGSSLSFQLPVQKSLASGVPMPVPPGHGVVQMFPCRSDVSSLNCWRPT